MAYVPPHKRHLKDKGRPSPMPALLVPQIKKNLNLESRSGSQSWKERHTAQGRKIIYAMDSISLWWIVGLDNDSHSQSLVKLEPVSCEPVERRRGEKPLALVCAHPSGEPNEVTQSFGKSPWLSIIEKIQPELLKSSENVWNDVQLQELVEVKPSFVARFGKVFFFGRPSIILDSICKSSAIEHANKNQVNKLFYTNVPEAYVEDVQHIVIPKIGFIFDAEREHYHVKVYDKLHPDSIISCKCTITEVGGELKIHKIEQNPVRHLVADLPCINKDLDLRLMLSTKRILTALRDEEEAIKQLIKSAVMDPDVKGGLRWPLGSDTLGDRFSVVGVWHTKYKSFKDCRMRLKLRQADRFDFRTSSGEVSREVTLKMTGIATHLKDGVFDTSLVTEMLQESLELVWDNFLSCGYSFT